MPVTRVFLYRIVSARQRQETAERLSNALCFSKLTFRHKRRIITHTNLLAHIYTFLTSVLGHWQYGISDSLLVLGIELRASHMLSPCSTYWPILGHLKEQLGAVVLENLKIWESVRKTPLTKCSHPGETGRKMRVRPKSQLDAIAKIGPLVLLFAGCGFWTRAHPGSGVIKGRSSKGWFSVVLLSSPTYSSLLAAAKDPTCQNLPARWREETSTNLSLPSTSGSGSLPMWDQ